MPALEVMDGRVRDRRIALEERSYVVGSQPDSADIVLSDPTVSRVHAGFERFKCAPVLVVHIGDDRDR